MSVLFGRRRPGIAVGDCVTGGHPVPAVAHAVCDHRRSPRRQSLVAVTILLLLVPLALSLPLVVAVAAVRGPGARLLGGARRTVGENAEHYREPRVERSFRVTARTVPACPEANDEIIIVQTVYRVGCFHNSWGCLRPRKSTGPRIYASSPPPLVFQTLYIWGPAIALVLNLVSHIVYIHSGGPRITLKSCRIASYSVFLSPSFNTQ